MEKGLNKMRIDYDEFKNCDENIDLSGMSIIDIFSEDCNYYERFCGNEDEEFTLRDCFNLAVKNGFTKGVITVLAERPLDGTVYRYGNHGDCWECIGKLVGYA